MTYIDGFVIPVRVDRRQEVIDHAEKMDRVFIEMGALRVTECWADDVPEGKVTDFYRAVDRAEGETVLFSWVEWPDKQTRDNAFARMEQDAEMMATPAPFDGKRMIFGGFVPIVDLKAQGGGQ